MISRVGDTLLKQQNTKSKMKIEINLYQITYQAVLLHLPL